MTDGLSTILCFDFGIRRIGVAVGQTITRTATPLTTLTVQHGQIPWAEIDALVSDWKPNLLLLGLPTQADDRPTEINKPLKRFGNQLNARYNLPIEWMDERLSSHEAEQRLRRQDKKAHKGSLDQYAASLILESWMQQAGH